MVKGMETFSDEQLVYFGKMEIGMGSDYLCKYFGGMNAEEGTAF